MKCIDFKKKIITELDPQQKEHFKICSRCRTIWEDQALDRLIINLPFDFDLEDNIDLSAKPPTGSFITAEFWKEVETHFSEKADILKNVDSFLVERFKNNPIILHKLRCIASKISLEITPLPHDFGQRFSSALGYFTDSEAENIKTENLIKKLKKQIDDSLDV